MKLDNIKNSFVFGSLIGLFLLMPGLHSEITDSSFPIVSGEIDTSFVEHLNKAISESKTVIIESTGGFSEAGFSSGRLIYDNEVSVIISGDCMSACAEFILTSAKTVQVPDPVLFGLHRNTFIFSELANAHFPGRASVSPARYAWLSSIYESRGLTREFYKETMARLDIRFVDLEFIDGMNQVQIYSTYSMWFPTSQQVRNLWNLDFEGQLCADTQACWAPRLSAIADPGEKFVVGDVAVSVLPNGELKLEPWARNFSQTRVVQPEIP